MSNYDNTIVADWPTHYWAMSTPSAGSEVDLSGYGLTGVYKNGVSATRTLPNGDVAAYFNGVNQFMQAPDAPGLSVTKTGQLTWEAWIRPEVLQFPHSTGGYVDWMGKTDPSYKQCEWQGRMYNQSNPQNRYSRLSAYYFNLGGGLGSGADWQEADTSQISAGQWLYVVGEYQILTGGGSAKYPGTINIWVDGVPWDAAAHHPTGYFSQYDIAPKYSTSPLQVGTSSQDSWFDGAIGKVALYDRLLTQNEIDTHWTAMTSLPVGGTSAATCTLSAAAKALR